MTAAHGPGRVPGVRRERLRASIDRLEGLGGRVRGDQGSDGGRDGSGPQKGADGRVAAEALALVLCEVYPPETDVLGIMAERLLADPGPLLAALAEAGVLREVTKHRASWVNDGLCQSADTCPDPMHGPHTHAHMVKGPHNRYVTAWRPADA